MKEWLLEKLLTNDSFNKLPDKVRYILPSQIAKELQQIYEAKGEVFLDAYKAELSQRLLRTNWLWTRNPKFPFQKWSKMKAEIANVLAGNDKLIKPSQEVIAAQVHTIDNLASMIAEKMEAKTRPQQWVKSPNGGWMRKPS